MMRRQRRQRRCQQSPAQPADSVNKQTPFNKREGGEGGYLPNGDVRSTVRDEDFGDDAAIDGLPQDGRLVRLDVAQRVARRDFGALRLLERLLIIFFGGG